MSTPGGQIPPESEDPLPAEAPAAPGTPPSAGEAVPPYGTPPAPPPPSGQEPPYAPPGNGGPGYSSPGYGGSAPQPPGYGTPGYGTPGYGTPGYGTPGYAGSGAPGYPPAGYGAAGYSPPGSGMAVPGGYGYPPGAPFGLDPYGRPYSDKSKVVAGLLQIFLGSFGAGRWYTGHYGMAIAMLLTCGGLGVWALIDAIILLVTDSTDAQGRPLRG